MADYTVGERRYVMFEVDLDEDAPFEDQDDATMRWFTAVYLGERPWGRKKTLAGTWVGDGLERWTYETCELHIGERTDVVLDCEGLEVPYDRSAMHP
ncbi:Uncharacterised protein (plasmid) [Tsukamurella tyrosinosolvens]|uniref:Uncharacterized protein n=1 Tax=Tsukamurella tyrosinosolvens TaxID=57704 RepID=A0A1H4V951_TSUTY|nr:hypothetical protein [Tsukamurella tyrosinosolvens]KXO91022.1 hypothetical protein AXK58_21570 [Tsukamurella tyrosinosolvens]SEC77400.1 hypothetical protein SAMN04489793_3175 [Tsukamurella tyrosinosolvens]VEH90623.1 Uncharacterised protein [Tsukamurella tyrosinosolvens]